MVIPAEAVVRSGRRNQVFVVRESGKFEPRALTLGLESNGQVAVLAGIEAGEEVVTSAQFLIDSESSLREAAAKMVEATHEPTEHNHAAPPADPTETSDDKPAGGHAHHAGHGHD